MTVNLSNNSFFDLCMLNNSRNYDSYEPFSILLMGIVAIPIICFGWLANFVSVGVFTHKAMRTTPINWYLIVLSLADFIILVSSFFMLSLPRAGDLTSNFMAIRISYLLVPFMYALGIVAQTTSVYMTVLMSAHRFIGVCFPFKAGSILTKGRVKGAIAIVIFLGLLVNVTRFFEVRVHGDCWAENINYSMPVLGPTDLRLDETYVMLFTGWFYTIFMFVIPFTSLIVMNSKVIHAVRRTRKLHGAMGDDQSKKKELQKEISTSVMLIGIVVVFLTCNSLSFIVNIMENLKDERLDNLYKQLVEVSNLTVTIKASINIFVYCLFSEKYRLILRYFMCCHMFREGEMLVNSLMQ